MIAHFEKFYYSIKLSRSERMLVPKFLDLNYFYHNGAYIPKNLKNMKPFVMQGELIDNLFPALNTCEYPYYYNLNNLYIDFKGSTSILPIIPAVYDCFVDEANHLTCKDKITNMPRPLDTIKVGEQIYILDNQFSFGYNYSTQQLTFFGFMLFLEPLI